MIAVRLRARNPQQGHLMRTYVSHTLTNRYTAGEGVNPSPWRVISDEAELEELRAIPQFELKEFKEMGDLTELVQSEMEERARVGYPAIRANIDAPKETGPKRDLSVLSKGKEEADGEDVPVKVEDDQGEPEGGSEEPEDGPEVSVEQIPGNTRPRKRRKTSKKKTSKSKL